jgi:TRAP-type C4-dicarboxylate transport system permease small subunit
VLEEKFRPPASTTGAALLAGSFGLVYSAWIEHASAINGKFPYPFLNVMSIEQRIIFYIVSVVGALATFRFLNSLHR